MPKANKKGTQFIYLNWTYTLPNSVSGLKIYMAKDMHPDIKYNNDRKKNESISFGILLALR
jgi:hypothetical protein